MIFLYYNINYTIYSIFFYRNKDFWLEERTKYHVLFFVLCWQKWSASLIVTFCHGFFFRILPIPNSQFIIPFQVHKIFVNMSTSAHVTNGKFTFLARSIWNSVISKVPSYTVRNLVRWSWFLYFGPRVDTVKFSVISTKMFWFLCRQAWRTQPVYS